MQGLHIFLDTSVLYKDPFFKGSFSSNILSLARIKSSKIFLYMSRIVLDELIRNYEKIIKGENDKLEKILYDAKNYNFSMSSNIIIDITVSVEGLKRFYQNLYNEGVLEILHHDNSLLPEIVRRAVGRVKPFADNKNELKDALNWLVYSAFVEEYELNNCYFMTDNVNDFCDLEKLKKGNWEIHADLLSDTKRLEICRSFKELVQKDELMITERSSVFKKWLNYQDFDSWFIFDIIQNLLGEDIKIEVKNKFKYYDLNYIFDLDYDAKGFISFDDKFHMYNLMGIQVDIMDEECVISGILSISCDAEGYGYSADSEIENEYMLIGEKELNMKIGFSFSYDIDEKPYNFSVDSIEVLK
ncbi:PIN domain-containing protein [Hymenobacter lucidus]|uniref:PIN domain-containing protein n=1 Tax=Hymenobacter lucidus TaxID=2880930 RepID=A0ABS8AP15_9BACT|nr:PIN domain-containing protein [Hymenobacter lucidus]MCB2407930.1 PIN domain-containing protein [Hymenobacter lucidus]